jgi:hypothetical protein
MLTATLLEIASRCATVPVENGLITMKHNRWTACEFDCFIAFGVESLFDESEPKELYVPHRRFYPDDWFHSRTLGV